MKHKNILNGQTSICLLNTFMCLNFVTGRSLCFSVCSPCIVFAVKWSYYIIDVSSILIFILPSLGCRKGKIAFPQDIYLSKLAWRGRVWNAKELCQRLAVGGSGSRHRVGTLQFQVFWPGKLNLRNRYYYCGRVIVPEHFAQGGLVFPGWRNWPVTSANTKSFCFFN